MRDFCQFKVNTALCSLLGCLFYCWGISTLSAQVQLVTQLGHQHPVKQLIFSTDDQYLYSIDEKGILKCWDLQTRFELKTTDVGPLLQDGPFEMNLGEYMLSYLTDQNLLAVGNTSSPKVYLYDATLEKLKDSLILEESVNYVQYVPAKRSLAIGQMIWKNSTYEGKLFLYDSEQREKMEEVPTMPEFFNHGAIAFDPEGQKFVIGSRYGKVSLFDLKTGTLIQSSNLPQKEPIIQIEFDPSGKRFLSLDLASNLYLWEVPTLQRQTIFESTGEQMDLNGYGLFELMDEDQNLRFIHERDSQKLADIKGPYGVIRTSILQAAFGSQNKIFSIGDEMVKTQEHAINIWDTEVRGFAEQSIIVSNGTYDNGDCMALSKSGKYLVVGADNGQIYWWDVATQSTFATFANAAGTFEEMAIDRTGKHLITTGSYKGRHVSWNWNLERGELAETYIGLYDIGFSNQGEYMGTYLDVLISAKISNSRVEVDTLLQMYPILPALHVSPNDSFAMVWETGKLKRLEESFPEPGQSIIKIPISGYDLATGERKFRKTIACYVYPSNVGEQTPRFSQPFGYSAIALHNHAIQILSLDNGKIVHKIPFQLNPYDAIYDYQFMGKNLVVLLSRRATVDVTENTQGESLKSVQPLEVQTFDPASGKQLSTWTLPLPNLNLDIVTQLLAVSPSQDRIALMAENATPGSADTDRFILVIDMVSQSLLAQIPLQQSRPKQLLFHPKHKDWLLALHETDIRLHRVDRPQDLYYLAPLGPDGSIFLRNDGYFFATKSGIQNIGFRKGKQVFQFDQFEALYNQPDRLLDDLPWTSDTYVTALRKASEKRRKRLGKEIFTSDELVAVPTVEIRDDSPGDLLASQSELMLHCTAKDAISPIDRIHIWINGVPVYGSQGLPITPPVQNLDTSILIQLSNGLNQVEVAVSNQDQVYSLRSRFTKELNQPNTGKPTLYLATIGVSNYQAPGKDLKYAAKDARDIAAHYQSSKAFAYIKSKTLTDAEVSKASILELRSWLEQSTINDQVLIFVSGHGLLDQNYDFYYGTHDIDFANPSEKGILYDQIEGLLDGIPARKKLLLIDACHSGEYDKDSDMPTPAEQDSLSKSGIKFQAFTKGDGDKPVALGLQNSFELMQQLFADLRRGSGTTVISSSSGAQFSYERDEWANGAFTFVFLYGLKSMEADANNDGAVSTSEIQNYVAKYVSRLTSGRQKPTFRQQNLAFDSRVW